MVASSESAGAQFIATFSIAASPASAAAHAQLPAPFAPMRAMPLARPAGFAPPTMNPKKTLPVASTVIGVLMNTVASYAAGFAA